MPCNRFADDDALPVSRHLHGAEVLGQSFMEPQRRARERVVEEEVGKLMEDDRERAFAGFDVHRDVVDVRAVDKQSVNRHGARVDDRHEWTIRLRVREDDDHDWCACGGHGIRQQLCDNAAELLESECDVAQPGRCHVADDAKVIGAHLTPFGGRRERGTEEDGRREEKKPPHSNSCDSALR